MLGEPDDLLPRAGDAIATARRARATVDQEQTVHELLLARTFPRQAGVIAVADRGGLLSAA